MIAKAIKIAATVFENDYDKGGEPYIMHLLYVMHKVKHLGETAMVCAILHDLVEDKSAEGYDMKYLEGEGFSSEVRLIVELLTHRDSTPYMDYVKALAAHPTARAIKIADLEHNTKVSRLKGLCKKDFERLEKYIIAYQYLKD